MKILITDKIGQSGLNYLKKRADVLEAYGLKGPALATAAADVDGWMVRSGTQVTPELLAAAPRLKVIARAGSGVDNVDVPEATRRGILVVNAPGGNAASAAEMTVALLMACARKLTAANASLRRGEWNRELFKGFEIEGKTVGLLGLGSVGKHLTQILKGFGARVIAYDPFVTADQAAAIGVELTDQSAVVSQSDILSVHVPLTDKTRNLVDADAFGKMKKGVVVLNAARGGIVDEAALYAALVSGHVAAAGIDVFSEEPPTAGSWAAKLVALDNVAATPHLGASTVDAQEKVALQAAEQLMLGLEGKPVQFAVNKPMTRAQTQS